ncbi:MAG: ABC transporter permease [Bacteroidales bacterium]|nr:ABC transporter permease [Bacteroidales bacterium]
MIGRLFVFTFRNLRRNLLYTIIVTAGMALGISTFMSIIQWSGRHLSFDRHFSDSRDIYRISLFEKRENFERHTARIIHGDIIQQLYHAEIPEIKKLARLAPFRNAIVKKENLVFYEDKTYACDPSFLEIFQPELMVGNIAEVLSGPKRVILSQPTVQKYFGNTDPIGKTVEICHQFSNESDEYEVTGIFREFPENSHFDIQLLTSFDDPAAFNSTAWVYSLLEPSVNPEVVPPKISELIRSANEENYARGIEPKLIALTDIHLRSHLARELEQNVHYQTVLVMFIAGMLVFVLAWFNFTLLAISQNQLKIKRLISQWQTGAGKKDFFLQFLVELVSIGLIAFFLGVLFSILISKPVEHMFGVPLFKDKMLLVVSFLIILIILLLSAFITALYATRRLYRSLKRKYFSANNAFDPVMHTRNWFIRGVIITEFVITFVLITNLLMINEQVKYSISRQIGSTDRLSIQIPNLPRPIIDKYGLFKEELLKHPGIQEVTAMMEEPGGTAMDAFGYRIEGLPRTEDRLFVFPVDENFSRFYDLQILAGKDFPDHYVTGDTTEYFLLNETAAKLHTDQYQDLIGRKLTLDFLVDEILYPGEVRGVVEDFHLSNMEREITPMLIFPEYYWLYCFSVRLSENTEQGIRSLEKVWKELFPEHPLRYIFTSEMYRRLYATELTEIRVLIIFSIVSVLIAGTGLYALSGFLISQKLHAAAIRRVNGASIRNILMPELLQYLFLAMVSSGIALPVAWFSMVQWRNNFIYQSSVPVWIFGAIAVFLVAFSWLAVIYHSLRLARVNPAELIRRE